MAHKFLSMQSFFQSEIHTAMKAPTNLATPAEAGDGFTPKEILKTTLHKRQNRCEYPEIAISSLEPAPGRLELKGRVVNMQDEKQRSAKTPHAAKRCFKLLVRDDTGVICVCCHQLLFSQRSRISTRIKMEPSCHVRTITGQALGRQRRLPDLSQPSGLDLDRSLFQCRDHLVNNAKCHH